MNKNQFSRRKTLAKSRYTLGGWLVPKNITQQQIYEPNYQLTSNNPVNFDHIQVIIQNCLEQEISDFMPTYDPANVRTFARNLCNNIKFRVQIQNFDRYRLVVMVNVTEKQHQGMNWQVGTLFDSTTDGWTSFEYETSTFVVNVLIACVYWD